MPLPALPPEILRLFLRVDHHLPLDLQLTTPVRRPDLVIERFTITSRHRQRVPGWLLYDPRHHGPRPAILIAHPATLEKESPYVTTPAREWVGRGACCVIIDQAGHGDRAIGPVDIAGLGRYPARAADDALQTAADWMRTVDYLVTRPEVDAGRIGFVGFSLGGAWGLPFVALDARVKTAVFCITGAARPGGGDEAARLRALTDPARYAPLIAPRPVLLVPAALDDVVLPEQAQALYDALGEPRAIAWQACGHWDFWPQGLEPIWPFLEAHL